VLRVAAGWWPAWSSLVPNDPAFVRTILAVFDREPASQGAASTELSVEMLQNPCRNLPV
jgi:hypothetical protein